MTGLLLLAALQEAPLFGPLEGTARAGFVRFSGDFEADPEFSSGLALRAPLAPLFDSDRLGAWLDVTVSAIERDVPLLDDDSGTILFLGGGLDVALHEGDPLFLRVQAGLQYGHFGGVDETDSGFAGVLGLEAGVKVAEGMAVVFNPQIAFGNAGDQVYFFNLGFQYQF